MSKRFWGSMVMVVSFSLMAFGVELSEDDTNQLTETLTTIGVGIGWLINFYGSMVARHRLTGPFRGEQG